MGPNLELGESQLHILGPFDAQEVLQPGLQLRDVLGCSEDVVHILVISLPPPYLRVGKYIKKIRADGASLGETGESVLPSGQDY